MGGPGSGTSPASETPERVTYSSDLDYWIRDFDRIEKLLLYYRLRIELIILIKTLDTVPESVSLSHKNP